ncbi:hypothetical protein [Pseudanabaena sp. PCC 6802]|uniref:hypothetical protein n=1 Tax=Pseudanabaena sp. PCC 6802 TaxID=118173 RepID=UPI000347E0FE|nr:hypothetical protein [Pseudanabaena sp. PCC 6802]
MAVLVGTSAGDLLDGTTEGDTIIGQGGSDPQLANATGFSLALRELDPDGNGFYRGIAFFN